MNSILIENFGRRDDIPRSIFQQLIAKASDEVKNKLERERPEILFKRPIMDRPRRDLRQQNGITV